MKEPKKSVKPITQFELTLIIGLVCMFAIIIFLMMQYNIAVENFNEALNTCIVERERGDIFSTIIPIPQSVKPSKSYVEVEKHVDK